MGDGCQEKDGPREEEARAVTQRPAPCPQKGFPGGTQCLQVAALIFKIIVAAVSHRAHVICLHPWLTGVVRPDLPTFRGSQQRPAALASDSLSTHLTSFTLTGASLRPPCSCTPVSWVRV